MRRPLGAAVFACRDAGAFALARPVLGDIPTSCPLRGRVGSARVTQSSFAEQARACGLSHDHELAAIAGVWRRWSEEPDAVLIVPHVEILARPSSP